MTKIELDQEDCLRNGLNVAQEKCVTIIAVATLCLPPPKPIIKFNLGPATPREKPVVKFNFGPPVRRE